MTTPVTRGARPRRDAQAVFDALFLTPEGRTNPYPLYDELRDTAPVFRSRLGLWVLTRYDDCWATLRDPRFGKDYARQVEQRFGADWRRHPSLTSGEHSMLNVDGPEHTRLRKLVSRVFTPRMIEQLKPSIARIVDTLLDSVADGGGNILEAVGFPLPVTIIGEMLGVPDADRAQFRDLVRDVVAIFELQPTAEQLAQADSAQVYIRNYFLDLIGEKRQARGDDLLSALIHAEADGECLTDDELATLAILLFAAGFETTTNLFGNGLLALLRHPDQLALLRRTPSLFDTLPDELLRYDGTVQMVARATLADVDVGDVTIPAGEQVFTLLGAANHDPARYDQPDRLDFTRTEISPLTFGGGVHFCLGAALARAEIGITFRTLLERCASIELASEPQFQDRLALRGLTALHVTCRAAARRAPVGPVAEVISRPTVPRPPGAAAPSRGLRPTPGDTDGDLRWRAVLRERIEGAPTRADSLPRRTGPALNAMVALLLRNSLFDRCTRAELEQLGTTAYAMTFEPGDTLCVAGAESPECYVIADGHAVVTVGRKGVATVGEHDVVGERGVLLDTVRSATVTATSLMTTYAISRERLRAVVDANPAAREWMLAEIHRRYPTLD